MDFSSKYRVNIPVLFTYSFYFSIRYYVTPISWFDMITWSLGTIAGLRAIVIEQSAMTDSILCFIWHSIKVAVSLMRKQLQIFCVRLATESFCGLQQMKRIQRMSTIFHTKPQSFVGMTCILIWLVDAHCADSIGSQTGFFCFFFYRTQVSTTKYRGAYKYERKNSESYQNNYATWLPVECFFWLLINFSWFC